LLTVHAVPPRTVHSISTWLSWRKSDAMKGMSVVEVTA
jgi:hypothetical protein